MSAHTLRLPRSASVPRSRRPALTRPLFIVGLPLLATAIALGVWQLAVALEWVNPVIMPAPTEIAAAMVDLLRREYFWEAVWVTLQETLLGFVLGAGAGLIIGAMAGTFTSFRVTFYPIVIAFQNTPRVALAPVFLTWFGFGITSKIVMAAVICFFPVVINTVAGIAGVDDNARLLFRSLGATRTQTFFRLTLPSAAPVAFAGIKTALTLALLGTIVAEFVGASEGLGVLIKELSFQLEVAKSFAVVVFLAGVGLALYGLVELAERRLITWANKAV